MRYPATTHTSVNHTSGERVTDRHFAHVSSRTGTYPARHTTMLLKEKLVHICQHSDNLNPQSGTKDPHDSQLRIAPLPTSRPR